ncbi:MAG: ABC transporter ATP-binding protein [Clostridia bacterium]|nr:ABC transporter ATP-binding protein [Clostridia bacterium]
MKSNTNKKVRLTSYLKPYWICAIISPLLMVVEVLVDLMQPTLMAAIVDEGVKLGNMEVIISTGIRMLLLVILGGLAGVAAAGFASTAAQSYGNDLRVDVYKKVMSLSLEQTDKFTTGSLVTRLTNDITITQDLVSMVLRMFVRAPLNFIGSIVLAVSLDIHFGVVLALALPLQLLMIAIILFKASPLFGKVQTKLDKVNSVVQENVTGARVVKAYVREEHEIGRFDAANADLRDTNLKVQRLMATLSPIMMLIMNAAVIAVILVGNGQVSLGNMEVGQIMAAISYITQTLMSLMMVSMMFQTISRARASAARVREVLECDPVIMSGSKTPVHKEGSVEFENVSFHYPGTKGRPVLNNISLKIKPGENVSILGATGSGKTSLVNLITRFYDVNEGAVYVDGMDVRDWKLGDLRSHIAFVLQKSELFSGTVMDNIRWGREDATDEEVIAAAKIAQADEFITGFVDGYYTVIGEKGASLSGGQKQRISIARAILRKPEILIFDDSTSALDLGTEARLRKALKENLTDTTVITIAQRIASVMTSDRIAVIENGSIVGCDTHEKLMESCPAYIDIYNSQLKREENQNG